MSAKDLRLYFLIQTAAGALKRRADEALIETTGLSTAQAAALSVVAGRDSVSMREIADALAQRESAMTTMVRRLEVKGLISKIRSETDKREWRVSLTGDGKDALEKSREAFGAINAALDAAFSDGELRMLAKNLTTLRELFDAR